MRAKCILLVDWVSNLTVFLPWGHKKHCLIPESLYLWVMLLCKKNFGANKSSVISIEI